MTGYLQRLAMSVGRAPPRLHPFAGVMFAEAPETDAPLLPRGEPFAASDDRMAAARPDAGAADPRVAPDAASVERAEPLTPRMLPGPVRRADEPPMAPSREPRDVTTRHPADASADATGAQRDSFRTLLGEVTVDAGGSAPRDGMDPQPATSRASALASGDDHPGRADLASVVHAARSAARPGGSDTPHARVSAASRKEAADDRRAAAQPRPPNGEDIHIHIGRVEVTAVPPPAPRPPPAPPRKTMTLEEYLGRRNGASR